MNPSRTAITISLIAGIFIFGVKVYAAHISNSSAIRSDALEGAVNILAAAFGLFSILFSEKPADHDHPYGHGKIEHFAAIFEGGLIAIAGFAILFDTTARFLSHVRPSPDLGEGLKLAVGAGLMNGVMGTALLMLGRKHKSTTLRADGLHLLSDLGSTIALAIGLTVALYTGWMWLDPLLAILVGLILLWAGYKVFRPSWDTLLDTLNPESIQKIVDRLNEISLDPVITIHELKAQEFGRDSHVDLHIVVPEFFSIKEAHNTSDRVVEQLRTAMGVESQIHAHVDPCGRLYCIECTFEKCPVRREAFVARKKLTAESVVKEGPI